MKQRFFYSSEIPTFLCESEDSILGKLAKANEFGLESTQRNAWLEQIGILKKSLNGFDYGHILFEYSIPRIGKRIDTVLLLSDSVYVIGKK